LVSPSPSTTTANSIPSSYGDRHSFRSHGYSCVVRRHEFISLPLVHLNYLHSSLFVHLYTLHSTNFRGTIEPKKNGNSPRRNTRKGTGTKERPVSWVWIFSRSIYLVQEYIQYRNTHSVWGGLWGKKVKKSFKVLSTGLQYLVCGCTMTGRLSLQGHILTHHTRKHLVF
jgi:hypothetical protein